MKKGFTLIELLAVIVILAIIALIAVPVVINIINDSKKSSEEQSVELYMDSVKKAIARKQLENSSFNPSICSIKNSGNILCGNEEIIVDIKGIKPNKGIIEIKENKITYKNLLLKGTYFNRLATPVQDNNNNGKPDIGDKYTYKVNDTDTFYFYVLSFNDDNTVNLIMDRNICNDGKITDDSNLCLIAWYKDNNNNTEGSNNTRGPLTAMTYLYNGTKEWSNVPDMKLSYSDEGNESNSSYGYGSIETIETGVRILMKDGLTEIIGEDNKTPAIYYEKDKSLKARLPKYSEVYNIDSNHCTGNGACPTWLVEYLAESGNFRAKEAYKLNNKISNIYGYWLLSSYSGGASAIGCFGGIALDNSTIDEINNGIRPVITVPKSYLE